MLSEKQVQALKPAGKDRQVADGGGLYLRVSKHGTKSWLYRSREGGAARYQTIGEYPALSLKHARQKASELQGRQLGTLTVSDAVEAYIASLDYQEPEQVSRRFKTDIVPTLGSKRLDVVVAKDITDALQKIVERGSPVAANRTLSDVKRLFRFAYEKGWAHHDPAERITKKVVGGKEKSRDIVLTDDELRDLIALLRSNRLAVKTRAGLALCLLTGQRASEVLGMQGEVSGRWWTIPKHRTKTKKEQKVYLAPLARYIARYIEPCSHLTLSRPLNRTNLRYTPHDLRRTMATRMSDLGVMPHVVEKCLSHQMTGVMQIYNRADFLPEREVAWKLWYAYLRRLTLSEPRA